jgi:ribonuclease HI
VIEVISDGSSSGKSDKPGGYGWVVCKDQKIVFAGFGGHPRTTNNVMEMTGSVEGMKAVKAAGIWTRGERFILVSDSQYVLYVACGRYSASKNLELATELQALFQYFRAEIFWQRGHQYKRRIPYQQQERYVLLNERCDQLAAHGREQEILKLQSR